MIKLDMDLSDLNLCVRVFVWNRNLNVFSKINAVFDTGAHTTHIDTQLLKKLGYDLEDAGTSHITTAGAKNMRINNTVLDNIILDSVELGPVLVNFSDLSDMWYQFILGMNVIKEFNSMIDFKNNIITMEPNFDMTAKIPVDNFINNSSRFGMWTIEPPL